MAGEQPARIVVSHVYSQANKGDAALTGVLCEELARLFPQTVLVVFTLSPGEGGLSDMPHKPGFMYWALYKYRQPLAKLAYTCYMIPATLVWAWWLRLTGKRLYLPPELRVIADEYAAADFIVPVGGGYIRSRKGVMNRLNIPLLLHPLLFAHLLGKPAVLYAQSVGPFKYRYELACVGFVLRRMGLVMLREDISVALLAGVGVGKNVLRTVDAGFLYKAPRKIDLRERYGISREALLVGVTVRSWLQGDAQVRYERAVAKAMDNVVCEHAAHVVFIPQVTAPGDDDRIAARRVQRYMREKGSATLIEDSPGPATVKAMYSVLDLLVGTRFHSVIFALTAYVPVIAIGYEHKTTGIMHDLGLDQWVVAIETVTATGLIRMIERLLGGRAEYELCLHKVIPPYVARAQAAIGALGSYYDAYQKQTR